MAKNVKLRKLTIIFGNGKQISTIIPSPMTDKQLQEANIVDIQISEELENTGC